MFITTKHAIMKFKLLLFLHELPKLMLCLQISMTLSIFPNAFKIQ